MRVFAAVFVHLEQYLTPIKPETIFRQTLTYEYKKYGQVAFELLARHQPT
jgi:hypothetical protein